MSDIFLYVDLKERMLRNVLQILKVASKDWFFTCPKLWKPQFFAFLWIYEVLKIPKKRCSARINSSIYSFPKRSPNFLITFWRNELKIYKSATKDTIWVFFHLSNELTIELSFCSWVIRVSAAWSINRAS